jgi:hypothetical protein
MESKQLNEIIELLKGIDVQRLLALGFALLILSWIVRIINRAFTRLQ